MEFIDLYFLWVNLSTTLTIVTQNLVVEQWNYSVFSYLKLHLFVVAYNLSIGKFRMIGVTRQPEKTFGNTSTMAYLVLLEDLENCMLLREHVFRGCCPLWKHVRRNDVAGQHGASFKVLMKMSVGHWSWGSQTISSWDVSGNFANWLFDEADISTKEMWSRNKFLYCAILGCLKLPCWSSLDSQSPSPSKIASSRPLTSWIVLDFTLALSLASHLTANPECFLPIEVAPMVVL